MGSTRSLAALEGFAREAGRSAFATVTTPDGRWQGGVAPDLQRPAASLLKLPLAVAAELALRTHDPEPAASVRDVLRADDDATILRVLDPRRDLSVRELIGLAVSASDGPSARYLLDLVGLDPVLAAIAAAGCVATSAHHDADDPGTLAGQTTAREAVALLTQASDATMFPITAHALRSSIRNSRIPLGAVDSDVVIAHKTGTLRGVANDVAEIRADTGVLLIAFLSEGQHDSLVTGYEMGICTREILEAWGLSAQRTTSALVDT